MSIENYKEKQYCRLWQEVKKEIFDNSYVSSDSSAVYINGKVIPFKNENDIAKIKEWKEDYTKAKNDLLQKCEEKSETSCKIIFDY
mgnify:CR=1 FL=1